MLKWLKAASRAVPAWLRHRWLLSRTYDRLMRWRRGYGGFTGTDRSGYPLSYFFEKFDA